MLIDSVYIKDKNYYLQVFLEKYKHVVRKKKSYFVTDDSDDSDEKNKMKKIKHIIFLKKKE